VPVTPDPITVAREISDGFLFPGALEVDASDVVPVDRLDRLAQAGLYGLAGPTDAGGMGLTGMATALEIIEIMASGCLTSTFVWIQHHGAVRAVGDAPPVLRNAWLARLCSGAIRAGVAFSGLRRPGPPILTAAPDGEGWRFKGFAPWVTGWGRVDVVRAAARREDGDIVWALIDATAGPTLRAEPLRLAAVNASATVTLSLDNHVIPPDRVISIQPFDEWQAADRASLRLNGSLALGIARRCAALLGSEALEMELGERRSGLDQASPETMPEQRARASELALRAATTLVVSGGGRSISVDHHAQRLAREALFLLVFGQTAAIKAAQLNRLYDESHG
jgi:alkylation response protein AidB-like acyl-CoA dehydrogenase